ncbi:DDE-Tnp-IS1595 domain-containing protein [Aphelenchoides besseyi]|nr:DDE-Tnp-IS1595 domain-containing protein [Aphelenchoides besseyi]
MNCFSGSEGVHLHLGLMTAITPVKRTTAEMSEFTINDLYIATVDDWSAIAFAASVGLLPNSRTCERCKRPMHLVSRQENIDKKRWICKISEGKKKKYCSTRSLRSGTFFEKSHLTIRTIVHILYWWSLDVPPNLIEPLCGITAKSAADFAIFLRGTRAKKVANAEDLVGEEEDDSDETTSTNNTTNGNTSRWVQAKRKLSPHESTTSELIEKNFRVEAKGAVFAHIIQAINKSFEIDLML